MSYKILFVSPVGIFTARPVYCKWVQKPHTTTIGLFAVLATPPSRWASFFLVAWDVGVVNGYLNPDIVTEEERNRLQFKGKLRSMRDVRELFIRPTPMLQALQAELVSLKQNVQSYEETLGQERTRLSQEKDDLMTSHRREVAELTAKIFDLEEGNRMLVLDRNDPAQPPQSVDASPKYVDTAVGPDTGACAMQERDRLVSEISGLKAQVSSLLASLRDSKGTIYQSARLKNRKKRLQSDMDLKLAKLEREKLLRNGSQLKADQVAQHLDTLETIPDNTRSNSKAELQQQTTKNETTTDEGDRAEPYAAVSRAKVDNLETRIRSLNVRLMASEDEHLRHKAHLEGEVKRLLYQREKKQIELNESQVTMGMLKGHIRDLKAELGDSQKLVTELEGSQQRVAELEIVNARFVSDLDSTQRLIILLTANNEVLLQKIIELGADATHLKTETSRLTSEIVLLQQALRDYKEEQEVEEAVLNLDEDQSSIVEVPGQPLESVAFSAVSATSDFVFAHEEVPPASLEESLSAMSERGALIDQILDGHPFALKDHGRTQILNADSDAGDYVLVRNPSVDPQQPSSAKMADKVFGK